MITILTAAELSRWSFIINFFSRCQRNRPGSEGFLKFFLLETNFFPRFDWVSKFVTASFFLIISEYCILIRFFNNVSYLKWCIYYIYGVSLGYIQQYSRLNLSFFSSETKKFPRAAGRARGLPSGIFWPRTKKALVSRLYCRIDPSKTP